MLPGFCALTCVTYFIHINLLCNMGWAKHSNCLAANDNPNVWFLVILPLCNALIQLIEENTVTSLGLLHTA